MDHLEPEVNGVVYVVDVLVFLFSYKYDKIIWIVSYIFTFVATSSL